MSAERVKHLALAVLYEPSNALARGLMGLVSHQGKWERPDQVSQAIQNDPARQVPHQGISQAPSRVEGPGRRSLEAGGLVRAERPQRRKRMPIFTRSCGSTPSGRVPGSTWATREWAGAGSSPTRPRPRRPRRSIRERQTNTGGRSWSGFEPVFRARMAARRAEAEKALSADHRSARGGDGLGDLRRGNAPLQKVAVQVFGQIDDPSASRSLVMLAVFGGSSDAAPAGDRDVTPARRQGVRRPVDRMIQKPIKYKVKKVGGPGQPGELLIKGQGSTPNLKRVYSPPPAPSIPLQPGDQVVMDANGLPVINRPEAVGQTGFMNVNQLLIPCPPAQAAGAIREHAQPKRPGPPEAKDRPIDQCTPMKILLTSQIRVFPCYDCPKMDFRSPIYLRESIQSHKANRSRWAAWRSRRKRRPPWHSSSCKTTSMPLTSTTTR